MMLRNEGVYDVSKSVTQISYNPQSTTGAGQFYPVHAQYQTLGQNHNLHHHPQQQQQQYITQPLAGTEAIAMTGPSTNLVSTLACNNTHASYQMTQQAVAPQCHPASSQINLTTTCAQHQQPIYNQIYQTMQNYNSPPIYHQTNSAPFTPDGISARQQMHHLNTNNDRRPVSLSLNLQLQQPHIEQFQPQKYLRPMLASTAFHEAQRELRQEKSASILSSQFISNPNSSTQNLSPTSTVGTNTEPQPHWRVNEINSSNGTNRSKNTTTNQRSKLVESSSSSNSTASSSSSTMPDVKGNPDTTTKLTASANSNESGGSKLKSYLTHLVLASNIPFAYAIIMVAFLITFIAATSIITILTIVLTITGYTAYPITENTFNTSLAIGVVCASFALALVTASLVVWRRHCQAAYYYLDDPQSASRGTNSPQLSETYDDSEYGSVPVNDWAKHVQKLHADGDIGFSKEFEQIQKANQNSSLTSEHSQLIENKHKNRYINIVAYDHTRVTLRPLPGHQKKPGADYINANFIDVSMGATKRGKIFQAKS